MQWLENDFIGYLSHWEASVQAREGYTPGEKMMMTLSRDGLQMTGVLMCVVRDSNYCPPTFLSEIFCGSNETSPKECTTRAIPT